MGFEFRIWDWATGMVPFVASFLRETLKAEGRNHIRKLWVEVIWYCVSRYICCVPVSQNFQRLVH